MTGLRHRFSCLLVVAALAPTWIACGDEAEAGGDETGSGGTGQSADPEAPASCDILAPVTGAYDVVGEPTENEHRGFNTSDHQRGTVVIDDGFGIDFDDDLAFTGEDIVTCYDRTNQDHDRRIQVSYDADDSGRVINLYLTAGGEVDEIQFRHSDENVNVRVLVSRN